MEENRLAKSTECNAVSFEGKTAHTPATKLVVELIANRVKEQQPITSDDIINLYIDWKITTKQELRTYVWYGYNNIPREAYISVGVDEYRKYYRVKNLSRAWFKNNLANAIIRGKLLVIPIIEID